MAGNTEYKNRGILHGLHKVGNPSKNILMRAAVKTVLAAETTALFAKDVITNPFVGKEFHIKLERKQSSSGKFKTHIKLIRVEAPNKSHGIFHKMSEAGRFVEGDVKNGKGKKGFVRKLAHSALLTSEKGVIEAGTFAIRQTWQKLRNHSEMMDTGKAVMASITTLQTLNSGRKYLINYRKKRKNYLNLKQTYKGQKGKLKSLKKNRKSDRKELKQYRKEHRDLKKCYKVDKKSLKEWYGSNNKGFKEAKKKLRQSRKPANKVNKINVKFQKKNLKYDRKNIKNSKSLKKISKHDKNRAKVVPIAALPLVPVGAAAKQMTASAYQKVVNEVSENDFMQGLDKSYRVGKTTVRTGKKIVTKLYDKNIESKRKKLHKQENKLQGKSDKAKRKRKKKIDNSQKKFSEKAKEAAKKAAKATGKAVADFVKFAFKFFGITLTPILAIIIIISITMLLFSGASGNTGGYVLGTYNCQDKDISYAAEHYTKIAYDFNEKILRCGTDDWKNALNDFGVDTSSFEDEPNNFYFGRSRYFSGTPSYDFDTDKLAAFMCAYYYWRDDDDHIQNWAWDDSYDEILQKLFDTEYEFKSYYENRSYWKQLNNYNFYAGGGSEESYWTVYSEDFSKNRMKIRHIPEEIKAFCKDGYLHYDYNSLEILDANNDDKKTGYFIQDQRYIVQDPSGTVNYPFYSTKTVEYSDVSRYFRNGIVYYNTYGTRGAVVDINNHETLYWIRDINSSPLQYYKFVWKHGVDGRGIPIFEDRTGYYWTSDYKQIYCVVNPTDTHKWNGELEDICLVNFYKKNEWVTVCNLYYTVEKKCSFENAIKKVLQSKYSGEEYESRLEFYNLLTKETSAGIKTYGNHQLFRSPINKYMQDLIDDGNIYHGYGYDIQQWNTKHCEGLNNNHTGMDILASKGTNVYSMIDGYVNWINDDTQSISIMSSENISFWFGEDYPVEVIYANITTNLSQGDEVSEGDYIGKVTDYKHCFDNWDIQASKNYLHIEIKISYDDNFWSNSPTGVEPRFLIKREEE